MLKVLGSNHLPSNFWCPPSVHAAVDRYLNGQLLTIVKYNQLCLIPTLREIVKMFELQQVRITEIRIIEVFCVEIFKRPENFVRISNSLNRTSSN